MKANFSFNSILVKSVTKEESLFSDSYLYYNTHGTPESQVNEYNYKHRTAKSSSNKKMVKFYTEKREGHSKLSQIFADDDSEHILDRNLQLKRRINVSQVPSRSNFLLFSDRSSLYTNKTPKKKRKGARSDSKNQAHKDFLFAFNKLSILFEKNLQKNRVFFFKTVIKSESLLLEQLRLYKNQNVKLQSMVQRLQLNQVVRQNSFKEKFLQLQAEKARKQVPISTTKSTTKLPDNRSDYIEMKDSYAISQDSRIDYSRSCRINNSGTKKAIDGFRQLTEYIKSTIEKDTSSIKNFKGFLERTKERSNYGQNGEIPCSVYNSKALMGVRNGKRKSQFSNREQKEATWSKNSFIFTKESPLSLRLTNEAAMSLMKKPRDMFRKARTHRIKEKRGSSKKRGRKKLKGFGKRKSCQGRI